MLWRYHTWFTDCLPPSSFLVYGVLVFGGLEVFSLPLLPAFDEKVCLEKKLQKYSHLQRKLGILDTKLNANVVLLNVKYRFL